MYQAVLFDFYGVLCGSSLWADLENIHPKAWNFIQTEIFGENRDFVNRWMRGEITLKDVHNHIISNTDLGSDAFHNSLMDSIRDMAIDDRLIELAQNLKSRGVKVAIVTDNMDVFDETIRIHRLDEVFLKIVNSCRYGRLKSDGDGELFDIALEMLGISDCKKVLLIDDSKNAEEAFKRKERGDVFHYKSYEKFEPWMRKNLF
jgi:FMN phosphatase YigB (HAD superfamily)